MCKRISVEHLVNIVKVSWLFWWIGESKIFNMRNVSLLIFIESYNQRAWNAESLIIIKARLSGNFASDLKVREIWSIATYGIRNFLLWQLWKINRICSLFMNWRCIQIFSQSYIANFQYKSVLTSTYLNSY